VSEQAKEEVNEVSERVSEQLSKQNPMKLTERTPYAYNITGGHSL
jgi:hypothetical protein